MAHFLSSFLELLEAIKLSFVSFVSLPPFELDFEQSVEKWLASGEAAQKLYRCQQQVAAFDCFKRSFSVYLCLCLSSSASRIPQVATTATIIV